MLPHPKPLFLSKSKLFILFLFYSFRLELLANAYRMHHPERNKLTKSGTFPILPRLPAGAFSLNHHGFLVGALLTNASYPEATEERTL